MVVAATALVAVLVLVELTADVAPAAASCCLTAHCIVCGVCNVLCPPNDNQHNNPSTTTDNNNTAAAKDNVGLIQLPEKVDINIYFH